MADVAKTNIVSNENHNGMLVDDAIKNSPNNDSNNLTECSGSNHTNSDCSNRNSCSSNVEIKEGYQEVDSFSELSFRTTDDISLQDLIESEFAARISSLNGDEFSAKTIDELFDNPEPQESINDSKSEDQIDDFNISEVVEEPETPPKVDTNLDDFISGPIIEEDPPIIELGDDDVIDEVDDASPPVIDEDLSPTDDNTNPVNVFKAARPTEIPIVSNFDPFARIEEDSDYSNSNPLSKAANEVITPDEFPFPESPVKELPGKEDEVEAEDEEKSADDEKNENQNGDGVLMGDNDNIVKELFCKTISDENLDSFSEPNYGENEGFSKFHVVNNMSSVESVNNSFPNISTLTSPDRNDGDDFFQPEEFNNKSTPINSEHVEVIPDDDDDFEISPAADKEIDFFVNNDDMSDGEMGGNIPDIIQDIPKREDLDDSQTDLVLDQMNEDQGVYKEEQAEWTTVEDALKAHEEDVNDVEDHVNNVDVNSGCVLNVTNSVVELNSCVESQTNGSKNLVGLTTVEHANGVSSSDTETETKSESSSSEKRSSKKKKSKKTKKSDEKENISVEPTPITTNVPSISLPTTGNDDSEDLSNVSVKNLMQTYCTEASKSFQNQLCSKEIIPLPVPIQNLKARSMVDLTSNANKVAVLRSNLFENARNVETSRSTNNLSSIERSPVVTGVSVRALKSSFSKFDQLSKKTVLHVRSVDATKVQKQFNEATTGAGEITCNCKSCGKQVFQMEQIKAEKAVWHKNCFRCKECNKQLTVDTYSSHEGIVYCKPHFRELFKPKAVLEDDPEPVRFRKPEMIIRENQPIELPPEVVRASDKPDLGLEELSSLNVKSRYQVFEKSEEANTNGLDKSPSAVNVKRSPSILSKLAKFQKKGMDIGVTDDSLNGIPNDLSSSSTEEEEEEEEDENQEGKKVIKSKKIRERPMSFGKMADVKMEWESGLAKTKAELREERRQEIQQIRCRLFMGKQIKMKEAYEQAVRESESASPRKAIDVRCEKAKSIKECFEKGEPLNIVDDDEEENEDKKKAGVEEDLGLFEAGISKKSRSLFLELDKSAKTQQNTAQPTKSTTPRTPVTPPIRPKEVIYNRQPTDEIVRSSDTVEDVQIETSDVVSKFKFFETYKEPEKEKKKFRITPPREGQVKTESPEREVYRDPNVVRAADKIDPEIIRTNTTTKMLSLFRQMEEKTEEVPDGPKPLKCFTPPPDYKEESEEESEDESEEESEEEEEEEEGVSNPNLVRASDKVEDEYLKQAANAARAKQLRAKFEKWEEKEREREKEELRERQFNGSTNNTITDNSENVEMTSIECTKSLLARFESMKAEAEQPKEKVQRPKVNRFVEIQNNMAEHCDVCQRRVYQLEKVETSGKIFHKSCFRCMQCNCLLRMETFTLNCGRLYCLPHFKQLFIAKGNYDEGFGVDQHKTKWPTVASF